jgi:hypothetical protein
MIDNTGFGRGPTSPRPFDIEAFWQKADEASLFHLHGPVHMGFPTRFHRRLRLVSYTGSIAGTMQHDIRLTRFLENVDASRHTSALHNRPHEVPGDVRN